MMGKNIFNVKKNKVISNILIAIIVLFVSGLGIILKMNIDKIEENKKYDKLISEFSLDINAKNELIMSLTSLVNDSKYLSHEQLADAYCKISSLYTINKEYEKSIDYTVLSLNYANKTKRNDIIFRSLNNLGNIFLELQEYKVAEQIFLQLFKLDIEDLTTRKLNREYAIINLAEIYSRTKEDDKAAKILELKFKDTDSIKIDSYDEKMISTIRSLINSRIHFNKGEYDKSESILNSLDIQRDSNNEAWVLNVIVNYLNIKAKLELCTKRYDESEKTVKELVSICNKNGYRERKVYFFHDMYILSEELNLPFPEEYKNYLLHIYPKMLSDQNESMGNFIIYKNKKVMDKLKSIDRTMLTYKKIAVVCVFIALIIYILIDKLVKANRNSRIDALTNINNRRCFDKTYKKYKDSKGQYGLIFIDVDNFKQVNDSYGHEFGDYVLKSVADVMKKNVRKTDRVFRYGGEEFCVLCNASKKDNVVDLAERLRRKVEEIELNNDMKVTISLGVSHSDEKEEVLFIADKNLYRSKNEGKNRVTS